MTTSVTISAGDKSVTITGDVAGKLRQVAKALRGEASAAAQQSFGFDTTHGFLGEELLLWLWFSWETKGGEFTLPGNRIVGIAIDDLIVFAPRGDDETQHTLRRGLPTRTAEARTALREGHRVAKARLILAEGSRQWSVTLDGATLRCASVRLPDDDEESVTAAERTADRTANWLVLHEILAALFGVFLRVRAGDGWKQEAQEIAAWMAGGAR